MIEGALCETGAAFRSFFAKTLGGINLKLCCAGANTENLSQKVSMPNDAKTFQHALMTASLCQWTQKDDEIS